MAGGAGSEAAPPLKSSKVNVTFRLAKGIKVNGTLWTPGRKVKEQIKKGHNPFHQELPESNDGDSGYDGDMPYKEAPIVPPDEWTRGVDRTARAVSTPIQPPWRHTFHPDDLPPKDLSTSSMRSAAYSNDRGVDYPSCSTRRRISPMRDSPDVAPPSAGRNSDWNRNHRQSTRSPPREQVSSYRRSIYNEPEDSPQSPPYSPPRKRSQRSQDCSYGRDYDRDYVPPREVFSIDERRGPVDPLQQRIDQVLKDNQMLMDSAAQTKKENQQLMEITRLQAQVSGSVQEICQVKAYLPQLASNLALTESQVITLKESVHDLKVERASLKETIRELQAERDRFNEALEAEKERFAQHNI